MNRYEVLSDSNPENSDEEETDDHQENLVITKVNKNQARSQADTEQKPKAKWEKVKQYWKWQR